jgi:hypothetical protein
MVRLEGLGQLKNPMASSGIEIAEFQAGIVPKIVHENFPSCPLKLNTHFNPDIMQHELLSASLNK